MSEKLPVRGVDAPTGFVIPVLERIRQLINSNWHPTGCSCGCASGSGSGTGSGDDTTNLDVNCDAIPTIDAGSGASLLATWIAGPACLIGMTGKLFYHTSLGISFWRGGAGAAAFADSTPGTTIPSCGAAPNPPCTNPDAGDFNSCGWNARLRCINNKIVSIPYSGAITDLGGWWSGGGCTVGDCVCCSYLHFTPDYDPSFMFRIIHVEYAPLLFIAELDYQVIAGGTTPTCCTGNPWAADRFRAQIVFTEP